MKTGTWYIISGTVVQHCNLLIATLLGLPIGNNVNDDDDDDDDVLTLVHFPEILPVVPKNRQPKSIHSGENRERSLRHRW